MSGGHTAYEGNYCDDQRDGFGVYYCKSGRLSYAGGWKKNLRDGLGVAFSHDGFIFVGNWKAGVANGVGTEFDLSGNPVRTGLWRDGKYIGPVGPADLTR
jgi:antitoxin component YwqK of YwqJK toxin-antitoxin module